MAYWNSPFHNPPTLTFTDKGLFPVGSVVTTRKDLTGFYAEAHNRHIGEQYIVDKYNQYGVMYLLNLDGTPCKWQLGGGSTAKCFEPVLEWQRVPVQSLMDLKVGDKIKIGDEENEVCTPIKWHGFGTTNWFRDSRQTLIKYYANNLHVCPDTSIPVYKQVPKMIDLLQLKQTTLGETTMKTKQFTKADLKTGHRVHFRNGTIGVFFESSRNHPYPHSVNFNGNWCSMDSHQEDLTYSSHSLDIVKVTQVLIYEILDPQAYEIIVWEREAPKSKEQIAYDEAVEATEAAKQAYELAQKKLEALNPAKKV